MASLDGKVVLITGAARGIGAATSRRLVSKGARVIAVDLDAAPLAQLADELGAKAVTAVGDVCDLASMQDAAAKGVEAFGGIDVVVANAGIASFGSLLAVDPVAFKRVIDVNITGVFHTIRAALPHVIERRGYVLVVGSMASYMAAPGLVAYNASKAGAEHLANALRPEVAHHGVDVGSAHMSWIDTPLVQDAKDDLGSFNQFLEMLPGPLKKTTSVESCAKAFVRGIEKRSTRVNVPGWVGVTRWMKPVLTTPFGERTLRRGAPELIAMMDGEVARLGRSTSARTLELGGAQSPAPEITTGSK